MNPKPQLKRALSLFHLTPYGIGAILGAGTYILIGAIAGPGWQQRATGQRHH